MLSERDYQELLDRMQALRSQVSDRLSGSLVSNPALAEELNRQLEDLVQAARDADAAGPRPPDRGLAELVGVGPEAAQKFGDVKIPQGVADYDESVNSERVVAVGDLYYIYQHERIGVFRVVQKLKQLFEGGAIRLSGGDGAYKLYQFDRRDVLRYTRNDRVAAYRRVLGYGRGLGAAQSRPNTDFHMLFSHFVNQVTLFWRDKRISDVIRERAIDPSFGSIAVVRRAGLDLRNNLKFTSFGHLNVLRVEVMQLLDECFAILGSPRPEDRETLIQELHDLDPQHVEVAERGELEVVAEVEPGPADDGDRAEAGVDRTLAYHVADPLVPPEQGDLVVEVPEQHVEVRVRAALPGAEPSAVAEHPAIGGDAVVLRVAQHVPAVELVEPV